jgi:uncharacterized protein YjbI with pentapeptide repeats
MDDERQPQQAAQAETNSTSDVPRWGELPDEERQRAADASLQAWEQLGAEEQAKRLAEHQGPFARLYLSGADAFYLAIVAVANQPAPYGTGGDRVLAEQLLRTRERFVHLSGLHLEGAALYGADLQGARLSGAHLEGAELSQAHLEGAALNGAHLEDAALSGAHLEDARLSGAHLEGATLYEAHLKGAALKEAHLEAADLRRAHLDDADLSRAYLQGADLRHGFFSAETALDDILLTDTTHDSAFLADVRRLAHRQAPRRSPSSAAPSRYQPHRRAAVNGGAASSAVL